MPRASRSAKRSRDACHQIKNSLQGIAGLLGLHAARRPEAAEALRDAIHQIHAVAHVYDLQAGGGKPRLGALVAVIVAGLRPAVPCEIRFDGIGRAHDWILPEREAMPIAMVVNELLWNAARHRERETSDPVVVTLTGSRNGGALLRVRNRGRLPAERSSSNPEAGGLDLARSLLPPGAGALELRDEGGWICAELRLRPPAVRPLAPARRRKQAT